MGSLTLQEIILMFIMGGWRRRYLIVIPIFLLPPLFYVGSKMLPKVYQAKTSILVQEPAKSNPFLNDWAVSPNMKERLPALTAMLQSEHVLEGVLRELGKINNETSYFERQRLVKQLAGEIKSQATGNDLITLTIRSQESKDLAKKLRIITEKFTDRILAPERGAIVNNEKFLSQQLEQKRGALSIAEEKLAQFKAENAEKLPTVHQTNVQRLSGLREKLDEKQKELSSAVAAFEELKTRITTTNPLVGKIEEQIVQVTSEILQLRMRYTDEHSEVIASVRRLEKLNQEKEHLQTAAKSVSRDDVDRLWNMAAGAIDTNDNKGTMPLLVGQMTRFQEAQTKRVGLEADIKQLSDLVNSISAQISSFAPIEQSQLRLERNVSAARDLFETLSKRFELVRITGALGQFEAPERVKVLDPPIDPAGPTNLPAAVFVIIGIFAGFFVGCALATVFELLDSRLRSSRHYANHLKAGVVVRIPRIRTKNSSPSNNKPYQEVKSREKIYALITIAIQKSIDYAKSDEFKAKITKTSHNMRSLGSKITQLTHKAYKNSKPVIDDKLIIINKSPSIVPNNEKRKELWANFKNFMTKKHMT